MNSEGIEIRSQRETYFTTGQYMKAVELYEQAIEQNPENVSNYWYLGLALMLQGNEADAQIAWMTPLLEAEPEQGEQWADELAQVIQVEAQHQESKGFDETAWLLRQHLREFLPNDLNNLLAVAELGLKANTFSSEKEILSQVTQLLQTSSPTHAAIDVDRLFKVVAEVIALDFKNGATQEFLEVAIDHIQEKQQTQALVDVLLAQAIKHFHLSQYAAAIRMVEYSVQLMPNDPKVLLHSVFLLQTGGAQDLIKSIPVAERLLEKTNNLVDKITATHHLLNGLMLTCGSWQETSQYYQVHKALLSSIANPDQQASVPDHHKFGDLLGMGMFFHYFEDLPAINRPIRNQVAAIAQNAWRSSLPNSVELCRSHSSSRETSTKPLKIGYLSSCLRLHSVGWLVRWLLAYHDRDRFDIHLYSTKQSNDPLQQAFITAYGDNFHTLITSVDKIAERINQDQIDILVELDSITSFDTCVVSALKPAPIQVTWLGCDASGIPAIDYYIADPYVLPNNAQEYYSETIWRLPQTYIAIDGFEVGIPDLRRDQLGIPSDAIVYLSSQTGLKRNPDNVRLQLQILKQVPNSYFLIKSFNAEPEFLKSFFHQLAEEEGVSGDRLRFLPDFPDNAVYRANLGLADVILDTYPYNGATTTLEALWVGLPIVTRVGEQFTARNSYTMMMNVGVTEGLAWSDQEYVEWGVRLGKDSVLRQNISYRLRQSRRGAPLWNGQKFTREMEKAYEQMWERQ